MKRADLTVGQEYLVHSSNDWDTGRGWGGPERYRLISLDKVAELGHRYGYRNDPVPYTVEHDGITYTVKNARKAMAHDTHNLAVMLRLENATGLVNGNGVASLVPFAKVRTTWAEGKAILDERERAAKRAKRVRDAALQERTLRGQAISERAALLGVRIQPSVSSASTMSIPLDVLDRLLDLATLPYSGPQG